MTDHIGPLQRTVFGHDLPKEDERRFRVMFEGSVDDDVSVSFRIEDFNRENGWDTNNIRAIKALSWNQAHTFADITMRGVIWRVV